VRAVLENLIEKELAGEPLSDQTPEHIGKGGDNRINLAGFDFGFKCLESHRGAYSVLRIAYCVR